MTKFFGVVGYGDTTEISPGVHEDAIVERKYYGDVIKNYRRLDGGEHLHDNISVGNSISIVADAYAYNNFFNMKYVSWMGTKWIVSEVEVERPRLILRLGGVYNGPTA